MQVYADTFLAAVKLFPLVALLITLPYMIVQYHRYGAILLLRAVIVYSFVFYLMCTALLTILPIPATASEAIQNQQQAEFIPFNSLREWAVRTGFSLSDPSTWLGALVSRFSFYILANVAMMIPLGMYLRYYFHLSFGKTVVTAFGFSLILELIQLSGLFGLSPVAYRMFDVDDILANTLGGVLGYGLARPLIRWLPSQQELNGIAYRKGMRVSVLRSITAALTDWLMLGGVMVLTLLAYAPLRRHLLDAGWKWRVFAALGLYAAAVLLWFILGEWLGRGRTAGKRIAHLQSVDAQTGNPPRFWQILIKYAFLYFGYPSIPLIAVLLLIVVVKTYLLQSRLFTAGFILMSLYGAAILIVVIRTLIRSQQLPHMAWSRLHTISTLKE
jgi:glycopeptide antibiotics resistance protein